MYPPCHHVAVSLILLVSFASQEFPVAEELEEEYLHNMNVYVTNSYLPTCRQIEPLLSVTICQIHINACRVTRVCIDCQVVNNTVGCSVSQGCRLSNFSIATQVTGPLSTRSLARELFRSGCGLRWLPPGCISNHYTHIVIMNVNILSLIRLRLFQFHQF